MAGWKTPELNGGFSRKVTYVKWSIFQHAMFNYRKIDEGLKKVEFAENPHDILQKQMKRTRKL